MSTKKFQLAELRELGFALHWLKRKSKKPIADAWSSLPVMSEHDLNRTYREGYNLGVRLGKNSKLADGQYLAIIDCDVKGTDPRFRKEMEKKLAEVMPDDLEAPIVLSGRGNGSKHLYVKTKKPVRFQRLAQSSEKVKVYMPSNEKPSKYEREHLTAKELKEGIRIKPAWDIALMGEGQQVVLPPSIHPDSGKPYAWGNQEIWSCEDIPLFKIDQEALEKGDDRLEDFKAVEVDLDWTDLSQETIDAIRDGEGVDDRSASLFKCSMQMLNQGMSEIEILSVLTDRDHYLGSVAYEHAQTKSRKRAAQWLKRYTLGKATRETKADQAFKNEVLELPDLSEEEEEQLDALFFADDPESWKKRIERGDEKTGSRPKNTLKNVILILQGEGGSDVFKRDEFANSELYSKVAPWGGRAGVEVTDIDTIRIKTWLANHYRFEPSNDRINEAVIKIADINRFHPVRDYLDRLEWDGVPRLDTWLKTYFGVKAPEPYLSAVSRKTLTALVARIYQPGIKFDHVLVLEGDQGLGKSRSLRALTEPWFTDAKIDVHDKDAVMTMRSIWLLELGEMSVMSNADIEVLKAFVSRETDRIRVPYGKRTENFPRQCVFVGTTNKREYLRDSTGNRRFWPVYVNHCRVEELRKNRDQLLAEAKFAYELGETLYLDLAEELAARPEQEKRAVQDAWEDLIADWLAKSPSEETIEVQVDRAKFRTEDLFQAGGPLEQWKLDPPNLSRVGSVLRKMEFESALLWDKGPKRMRRFWVKRKKKDPTRSGG